METQGVNIELGLDTGKFKKKLEESRYDFEKMVERLDSEHYFKLSVDKNRLQQSIAEAKQILKIAIERGDQTMVVNTKVDIDKMERELQIAKMKMRNFVNTWDEWVSVLGKMFDKVGERAWNALEKMRTDLMKMGKSTAEVDKLEKELLELNKAFNAGTKSQAEYYKELGQIEKKMEKLSSGGIMWWLKSMGGKMFAALGVANFASEAFSNAKEFGTLVQRAGVIAGGTQEEVKKLKDEILDLSNATGISNIELARTAETLASAGIQMQDIPNLLETISIASVASWANTSSVFEWLQAVINGYWYELKDAMAISDLFFRANAQGTISIENLAKEIGTVVPIANAWNVSLRELMAGYSTLTGVTGNASEVSTQLKGAIQSIVAPSEEWAKAMKALGVEYGANAIAAKGLGGVMKDLYEKAEWNPELIKAMIPEVRALTAVLALGGEQSDTFAKNLEGLQNAVGDTNNAFEQYTQSDEFRVQRGITAWENFKTVVGDTLLSLFATFSEIFIAIGDSAMNIINMIIEWWTLLTGSIIDALWLTSEETANSVDNQISYWEKLSTFLQFLWWMIVGVVQAVFGTITQTISEFVIGVINYFDNLWTNLKNSLIGLGTAIANTLLGIVNRAINAIMIPVNFAIEKINEVIQKANQLPFVNIPLLGAIRADFKIGDGKWLFEKLWEWIWSIAKSIWNKISTNFNNGFVSGISQIDNIRWWIETKTSSSLTDKIAKTFTNGSAGGGWWSGGGGGKSSGGWWGGEGKSKEEKEREQAEKEEKKRQEELNKMRTRAYEEWSKRAEKYNEIINNTNKKLAEQQKKLAEIRKDAEETIKDLNEKLIDSQASFHEKLSKRYTDIVKEVRSAIGDDAKEWSAEEVLQRLDTGNVGEMSQKDIDKIKEELELLKSQIDEETLKLEIKKEERSETEKITEEYQKQKELTENAIKMQEALKDGRHKVNEETGQIEFFDKDGNKIEAKNRDQEKDFAKQAEKIQKLADEELKIHTEKQEKLAEIVAEYEKEREKLNEHYFNEDKEMRLEQNRLSKEFFDQEITRLASIRDDAIATADALRAVRELWGNPAQIVNNNTTTTTNNTTNTQNVSVRTVSDVNSVNRALGSKLNLHTFNR